MKKYYDIQLDDEGDLPLIPIHTSGIEAVAQRVEIRLRIFFGEWFLDERRGLPWLEWKQQKPPNIDVIRERVRSEIRQARGVVRVESLEVALGVGTITIKGVIIVADASLALTATVSPANNAQPVTVLISSMSSGAVI